LVGGGEWRPHAPCGAKSKKKKKIIELLKIALLENYV
jgi:hypothetical protein